MTVTEARLNAGIKSGLEAARRLDVSETTVYAMERGKCLPTLYIARKIEKLYGVPIEEIEFPGEEKNDIRRTS